MPPLPPDAVLRRMYADRMSSEELLEILKRLNISLPVAGRIFANPGVAESKNARQVRRWISGDSVVPTGVAIALRLMDEHKVDVNKRFADKIAPPPPPVSTWPVYHPLEERVQTEHPRSEDAMSKPKHKEAKHG